MGSKSHRVRGLCSLKWWKGSSGLTRGQAIGLEWVGRRQLGLGRGGEGIGEGCRQQRGWRTKDGLSSLNLGGASPTPLPGLHGWDSPPKVSAALLLTPGTDDCNAGTWLGIPKTLWHRERGGNGHCPGETGQGGPRSQAHCVTPDQAGKPRGRQAGHKALSARDNATNLHVWTHLPGRPPAATLGPRRPPTSARLLGWAPAARGAAPNADIWLLPG